MKENRKFIELQFALHFHGDYYLSSESQERVPFLSWSALGREMKYWRLCAKFCFCKSLLQITFSLWG